MKSFKTLVGMSVQTAYKYLESLGYFLSADKKDGEICVKTCEVNFRRVNVDIENGIIVKFNGIG